MCVSNSGNGQHGQVSLTLMPVRYERDPRVEVQRQSTRSASGGWGMEKPHRVVEHHYHDHTKDKEVPIPDPVARGGVMVPFPVKLHQILDNIEEDGLADVISWQPHGRCFVVHEPEVFVDEVMPLYFKQKKFASFQRQLNLYGFQRLTRGADKGGYYHEMFLRGKPFLAHQIHRMRIKGTGVRPRSNPSNEPDFYAMPSIDVDSDVHLREETLSSEVVELSRFPTSTSSNLKKVPSALFPMETMTSNVVPFETTSCLMSELERPEHDDDDDDVIIFEGKPFHYLDHLEPVRAPVLPPLVRAATPCADEQDEEQLFTEAQMEALMSQLNRPGGVCSADVDRMNDTAFGNLLESLVLFR